MKWYDKAVFYHIYPLGLCGVIKPEAGTPGERPFEKLEAWLLHIADLGCTGIYIGPLFASIEHGYETTDYKKVDPRLGSNAEFAAYVKKCHEMGIRIIVDAVFNHTGREFFAFRDIKEKREQSAYKDWYCNVNFWGNNEYNDGFFYENWGGYNLLPKLNQKNPEVQEYLYEVVRYWVKEFDIDGIRLDAADVQDFAFMKGLRRLAAEVKEDFWLMGEVIHGDYSRWANPEMLHSVTNYELHKGLYSAHNDHNYFEIAHSVKRLLGLCGQTKLYTFVDNHDVARIYNKLQHKEHLRTVYMLLYTLPGIPSIYYGSEFAIEGEKEQGSDDSLRPCLDLEECMERKEGKQLLFLLRQLGQLKQEYSELSEGEYQELVLTNRQFAFSRSTGQTAVITAVNNEEKEASLSIPLPIAAERAVDLFSKEHLPIVDGRLQLTLEGNNGRLLYVY